MWCGCSECILNLNHMHKGCVKDQKHAGDVQAAMWHSSAPLQRSQATCCKSTLLAFILLACSMACCRPTTQHSNADGAAAMCPIAAQTLQQGGELHANAQPTSSCLTCSMASIPPRDMRAAQHCSAASSASLASAAAAVASLEPSPELTWVQASARHSSANADGTLQVESSNGHAGITFDV